MNADMLNRGTEETPPPPLSLSFILFKRGRTSGSATDNCNTCITNLVKDTV